METSLKGGFAQIFSFCPKNLSCPKFGGGAAAPLAPRARTPMLRNELRSCSKLKEIPFIRIFHESPKLRRIWFAWRVFLENWKQAHAILRDENHALDTYAIQWRTAKCLLVRKFFWCCFQPLSRSTIFFVRVVISKTNGSPNCKAKYLPKETLKN